MNFCHIFFFIVGCLLQGLLQLKLHFEARIARVAAAGHFQIFERGIVYK